MKQLQKPLLISVEGIDGSGKSTLAHFLYNTYKSHYSCILTKEPGATNLGKKLRKLLQEQETPLDPYAEFLLFAADRAQHYREVIKPALENNMIIITDRMADSSLVYQGYGRGVDKAMIATINRWVLRDIKPDVTVYVRVTAETAFERIIARNEQLTAFEKEKSDFFERLIHGFDQLYYNRSDIIIIPGNRTIEEIAQDATTQLQTWISERIAR